MALRKRTSRQRYWLYGKHAVIAALVNPMREIHRLVAVSDVIAQVKLPPFSKPVSVQKLDARALEALLPKGAVNQGIAAEVEALLEPSLDEISAIATRLMFLDQITDPHNVGAILRSCAAFDVDALIMTQDHAPPESGALARVASGALEMVPIIRVVNLVKAMETIKEDGFWCLGLEGEAKMTLDSAGTFEKTALIMGAEDKGLRRLTKENCDVLVRLPMNTKMESLNVSNAAAIALYSLNTRKI